LSWKATKYFSLIRVYLPGSGDNVIDLSKKTVMPGLIDMHVHPGREYKKSTGS